MTKIRKTLAHLDIQNVSMTYLEFMEWVMDHTPKGTKLENIQIDFDVEQFAGEYNYISEEEVYYTNSVMTLFILESNDNGN